MRLANPIRHLKIDLKSIGIYLCLFFAVLLIMFNKLAFGRLIAVYAVLIFVFQLPGTIIISLLTGKMGKTELLLGLGMGIAFTGIAAYLLGLMHIGFRISMIVSTGLVYMAYLAYLFFSPRIHIPESRGPEK